MADVDLDRIKRNVARMVDMDAPEADIDTYISEEGTTVEAVRAFKPNAPGIAADDPRMEYIRQAKERVARSEPAPAAGANHPESGERFDGVGMNATAGANSALYTTLGLPVDAMAGAMNLGIRGFNAATGSDVGTIDNPIGGSRSIGRTLGAVAPQLDPENTTATTAGERVARGVGEGIGYSVAPEAALAGLARTGVVAPRVAEMGGKLFGRAESAGAVAGNAAVGGISGAGSAAAMEIVPDEYKPIASMAGGLLAGGGAMAAASVPNILREGVRIGRNAIAPMTAAGRERLAGDALHEAASNPTAAREALAAGGRELVPGSAPTTGQATGDMGLLALERASSAKRPELFNQRRAEQNAARVAATEGLQTTGSPQAVVSALRDRVALLDRQTQDVVDRASEAARTSAEGLGSGIVPDEVGSSLRASLEAARASVKAEERKLWSAVDPDGSLVLAPTNARSKAAEILKSMPKTAKPLEGEEAAVFQALSGMGDAVPFAEFYAAKVRLDDAMKAERRVNGETASYRRMSMATDAVFKDLDRVVLARAMRDDAAVKNGRMAADQTLAARIGALSAPKTGSKVYSPSGQSYDFDYQLVEADDLIASNRPDGSPNPAYPAGLQPRDRTRAASDAQVAGIARNLQPERLGPSTDLATGAPLIGPDNVVESGNGRVAAIARAYRENGGSAKSYRDYLAGQGYAVDGMRNPVLVRRRLGELDDAGRTRLAQEANASQSLAMSASEQAATDASRMKPEILSLYRGGDVTSAENRDFARAFLGAVADKGQEGSFVTGSGALAMDGAGRMRNALLSAAYDDPRLVSALTDEGDENIRAFGRALGDISGDVARLRSGIKAGRIDATADLAPALGEAARIVQKARASNVRISDLVSQADAFNPVSDNALKVLQLAYGDGLSGRLSRERLNQIMQRAIGAAEQQSSDARLFGEPMNASAILDGVMARYGNASQATGTAGISGGGADRSGYTGLRPGEGRPSVVSQGASGLGEVRSGPEGSGAGGSSTRGGGRGVDPRILADVPLEPNFDDAALGRLTAARTATRERVETFDNKTLGPLRRRPSSTAPYDVGDATVAARLFASGAKSFENIQAYRRAVGDADAMRVLEGYAVDRLRKAALLENGTLDPAKVQGFRRSHADALRAFPALDARFANAARASDTLMEVGRARRAALDETQNSRLGKMLGLDDPNDIVRAIGSAFTAQDGVRRMTVIRHAVGADRAAQEGLRKAVVDHITSSFVGNTEAGTSGIGTIKSDGFQTFVRKSRSTMRAAGFSEGELDVMARVAEDLQRANRSITAVKLPGGSNTTQDLLAVQKGETPSLLRRVVANAMSPTSAGAGGFVLFGPTTGLVAAIGAKGAKVLGDMRMAGIEKVDDLIADALLNPSRARLLLATPAPKTTDATWAALGQMYRRSVLISGVSSLDGDGTGTEKREPVRLTVTGRVAGGNR